MKPRCDWEVPDTLSARADLLFIRGGGGGWWESGGIRKAPFKNCMTPS